MTPRAPLIPIRTRRPPIPFSPLQHLLHPFQTSDHFFSEGVEYAVPDDQDRRRGWGGGEEVVDAFVVYFNVGAAEKVFARGCSANVGEYIFHR